jgi:branched-chain amino acid transport system ATP-binding protein
MQFGVHSALDNLSFSVEPGSIHSIIGPNGAGKTTLFNVITGVYKPNGGRVYFRDEDITSQPPFVLAGRGLSRTFQNLQIFFNMTAIENVMVGMHLQCGTRFLPCLFRFNSVVGRDAECRDRAAELMRFVGLDDYLGAEAAAMPYGALKRLEIARALATEPKLLLLDEPAAGLNPAETGAIDDLIRTITERGITVVLVEHDMRLVMGVSDHILVLDRGRLLATGPAGEIRHNPDVVAAYLGESGRNR